jgi:hypothetical protein
MKAAPVPKSLSERKHLQPMEEIGIDPVPLTTPTVDGNHVINFGVCYGTGFLFTYEAVNEAHQKDVVLKVIRDFCIPYGHRIRKVHTDFAKIFKAKEFQSFLLSKGIQFQSSPPYQHQRNRVEGCSVNPLQNKARVLLVDAGLPPRFAAYAVRAAEDAHNCTLHADALITPAEAVTGKKPDIGAFREFGQMCYYHLSSQERARSADPRWKETAGKGILLGNSREVEGGYMIYPGKNRAIITRQDVVVFEGRESDMIPTFTDKFQVGDALFLAPGDDGDQGDLVLREPTTKIRKERIDDEPRETRKSARIDERRRRVKNAVEVLCACCAECECKAVLSDANRSDTDLLIPPIPRNIAEAERSAEADQWNAAYQREIAVMRDPDRPKYEEYHGPPPRRFMRAVLGHRVSIVDNELKFKARLCPDGSTQKQGVDYSEKYSPIARKELILMLLHIVAAADWDAKQFDVGSAYLEVPAQHEQYMRLTKDMVRVGFANTEYVKLLANFYGNPDAGRFWYTFFVALLLEFGMTQSIEAPCLFTIEAEGGDKIAVCALVVDDGLYCGNWTEKLLELEVFLQDRLHKVTFKPLTKFVGLEIQRDRAKRELYVSINDYEKNVISKYTTSTHSATTTDTPLYNTLEYRGMHGDRQPIRAVVGCINYMAGHTWPDLRVPASLLATAGERPHVNHEKGAMRTLRYVKEHMEGRHLTLGGTEPVKLIGYCDASYTPEGDSLFTYGYAIALSPYAGAYNVASKRSKTVSHSSLQSEIKSMNEICKEVESDRRVAEVLKQPQLEPTDVYTDSQSGLDLIANYFGYHPKCRHFNRDINYIRQCVDRGVVRLGKIHTSENCADLLTKLTDKEKTDKFTTALVSGVKTVPEVTAVVQSADVYF